MVRDEDQHAEVVGEDVGQLEPGPVVVEPFPAGLLGLVPANRKANRLVDDLGLIAGLDDDELKDLAEGASAVGVYLPDTKADQGVSS